MYLPKSWRFFNEGLALLTQEFILLRQLSIAVPVYQKE